jgi:hypothetical protein
MLISQNLLKIRPRGYNKHATILFPCSPNHFIKAMKELRLYLDVEIQLEELNGLKYQIRQDT